MRTLKLILAIHLELRITNDKNWPFCDLNIGKRESNVKARSDHNVTLQSKVER